jgi:hypothetical protein
MTYMEWILYGIQQSFCSAASCITHNIDELYEAAFSRDSEDESIEEWYDDEPPCIPGVVLFPSDGDPT